MPKLCACCKDHLTTGDNPNTASEKTVRCLECGEECQCDGCVCEQEENVADWTQEFLDNQTKFRYEQERYRRGF